MYTIYGKSGKLGINIFFSDKVINNPKNAAKSVKLATLPVGAMGES